MITEAQRAERVGYIGASDSAAVVGLSRWKTQLEVWAEKIGQVDPEDISDKLSVRMGNKLEAVVAELFEEETGKKVHRVNETVYHPKYPFLAANLDRRVVGEDAILEIKTAGAWAAKEWAGEDIPAEVIIQVMHQLACSGKKVGYACVLIGGNQDFKWKRIERDEKAISQLIAKEVSFWHTFVIPKAMPATILKGDTDMLFKLFPEAHQGEKINLDGRASSILESIESLKQDKKNLEGVIEQQENEIKSLIGDAEFGIAGKYTVSWKSQITKRLNTEKLKTEAPEVYANYLMESKSRVFRIKKNEQ